MDLDELVLAVRGGDSRAWNELGPRLIAELGPYFQRWFAEADARDLTQDTLVVVVRKLPEFKVDAKRPFRRWVRSIAHTQIKEAFRQQGRRDRLAHELAEARWTPPTSPTGRYAQTESLALVVEALDEIADRYRRAIEHDLQDGDPHDFARRERIERGSVRTRRRRAYQVLRRVVRRRINRSKN